MEILLFSLGSTMPVVLIMAVGLFLRVRGAVDEKFVEKLSGLVFFVFLQFHLFNSIYSIDFKSEFSPRFVLFGLTGVIACIVFFTAFYRITLGDRRKVVAFSQICFRTNYLMFGLAVVQNMFGESGARVAAMLVPVAIPFFNLAAVGLFAYATADDKLPVPALIRIMAVNIAKSPMFITCILGIAVGVSGIVIPSWIYSAIKSLGGAATPLCLLLLGAQIDWKILKDSIHSVVVLTVLRLIVIPLIMVPAAVWMGFRGPYLASIFMLFGSPCATTAAVMAHQYNVHPKFTSQVVALTTVASGLTTFLGIYLMRYFQLI